MQQQNIVNNKRKFFESRLTVALILVLFWILLIVFSILGDNFNQWSPWNPNLLKDKTIMVEGKWATFLSFKDTYKNASIRFSFMFIDVILLSVIIFFVSKELNKLIFNNKKLSFYLITISNLFFYLLISLIYLVPLYFYDSSVKGIIDSNGTNELHKIYDIGNEINLNFKIGSIHVNDAKSFASFGVILVLLILLIWTLILDLSLLGYYRIFNKKNFFSLLFIHLITQIGIFSASYTLIVRGWTTLLLIALIGVSTDVYSYFFGKKIGKTKLIIISPNKTWEGAFFGILTSVITITSLLILYAIPTFSASNIDFENLDNNKNNFYDFTPQKYDPNNLITNLFIISFFLGGSTFEVYWWIATISIIFFFSLLSIGGDLTFSYIKRKYNIKDFSNLLGRHGGILDRIDSHTMIFSFYLIYLMLVFLISNRSILSPNSYFSSFFSFIQ